jgi:hypothetical protein
LASSLLEGKLAHLRYITLGAGGEACCSILNLLIGNLDASNLQMMTEVLGHCNIAILLHWKYAQNLALYNSEFS